MTGTAGLSLEQAPPISVPFRFFLTAPLFGILAGVLAAWTGPEMTLSRWLPSTLAFTHLLTLGFLSMIMLGAMMQMLPVLAGSPVPAALPVARSVHAALTAGTLVLAPGLLFAWSGALLLAVLLLTAGLGLFLAAAGVALARVPAPGSTVAGMRWALAALAATLILGTLLVLGRLGLPAAAQAGPLTDLHAGWGLLGWVAALFISVSYQVVPMFQVTPDYPRPLRRLLVPSMLAALAAWSLAVVGAPGEGAAAAVARDLPAGAILLGLSVHAVSTLGLWRRRRRRVPDATAPFWYLGLAAMLLFAAAWMSARWWPAVAGSPVYPLALGGLALVGAGLSLTNGMLYRILPFLCWFHLQDRQMARRRFEVTVPHMKAFVGDGAVRGQYLVHLAAIACGSAALLWLPGLAPLFGMLLAASNGWLLWNLARAVGLYRRTLEAIEAPGGTA